MAQKTMYKIGVHTFKPLVYFEDGKWTGFEIELWEHIAREQKIKFQYIEEKNFNDLLIKTKQGTYDVAIAGLSRTVKRKKNVAMSFFTLDTGQGIAMRPLHAISLKDLIWSIASKQTLTILSLLLPFIIATAHIYWIIERGFSVSHQYLNGIMHSLWWTVATFSTVGYGDITPLTHTGKTFGIIAILIGLGIFGLYISQLSASLTLLKKQLKIQHPDDLAGKKIAVKKHSTAYDLAKERKAKIKTYATFAGCFNALHTGKVDAVLADLPLLQHEKKSRSIEISPHRFIREAYAFMLSKKHKDLLEKINKSLIASYDDHSYDTLYHRYF